MTRPFTSPLMVVLKIFLAPIPLLSLCLSPSHTSIFTAKTLSLRPQIKVITWDMILLDISRSTGSCDGSKIETEDPTSKTVIAFKLPRSRLSSIHSWVLCQIFQTLRWTWVRLNISLATISLQSIQPKWTWTSVSVTPPFTWVSSSLFDGTS